MIKKVKICPNCGSINTGVDFRGQMPFEFCKNCGYGHPDQGYTNGVYAFPEIDISKVDEFREKLKIKKNIKKTLKKAVTNKKSINKVKEKRIKVCSKCGSTNIGKVPINYSTLFSGPEDTCLDCLVKEGPNILQAGKPKVVEISKSKLLKTRKKQK